VHTGHESVDEVLARAVAGGDPADALTRLDGAFAAFVTDAEGALTVVTDPLGLQPLYRARAGGRTVYGSTVRGTLAAAGLPPDEDLAGTGALLLAGHMLGDRTVAAGVRRVPPAVIVRHCGGTVDERTWWRLPTDVDANAPPAEHVAAIEQALTDWYGASRREYGAGTLFLSGGYDSRLAAGLLAAAGEAPPAVALRHRDENADADFRVARAVGRALGVRSRVIDPPADYYDSDAYAEYLRRTEAMTPSLFLFIATIELAGPAVEGAAWDGLLPGFLNVAPYEEGGFGPYLDRVVGGRADRLRQSPFRAEWLEAALAAARTVLDAEVAAWPDTAAGVLGFGLRNRARLRFAPNPLAVLGARGPVHLPGATRAFWEAVARTPVEQRAGGRMHMALLERLAPSLARLPVVSGPKVLPPYGGSTPASQALRLAARVDRSARRGRLRPVASALGLSPFAWAPSVRAMGALRRALDDTATHDPDRAARLIGGRAAVEPGDAALLPLVHRQRALEALGPAPA
jgi:hypothetical protein